jgi:hypothetical protein
MKRQLLDWLRCLECRSELTLDATATAGNEVVDGTLTCKACGRRSRRRRRAANDRRARSQSRSDRVTAHTAEMFGTWEQTHAAPVHQPRPWHYAKMERALELAPLADLCSTQAVATASTSPTRPFVRAQKSSASSE